jgi:hypothetical protein
MDVQCQSCGARLTLPDGTRSSMCPYCDSPQVVERPPAPDRPNPHFVLGFRVGKEEAHRRVRAWLKGRTLFAPNGIHQAKAEEVKGVYLPAYLYGARATVEYSAEIGEDYTELVTRGSGKNRRTTLETKTEWRPLSGTYEGYVSDVLVSASRGVENAELERVEPFDLRQLARYHPAAIAGWAAEEPSRSEAECRAMGHQEADKEVQRKLAHFMPGDHHRSLTQRCQWAAESLELVLAPLWVFALRYDEDKPPLRVLVNGQTGKPAGKVPLSWVKIGIAVLIAAALMLGIVVVARSLQS